MNYPLAELGDWFEYAGEKAGIIIRCPNCGSAHSAWFKTTIPSGRPGAHRVLWDRVGETLETLTLNPSFLAIGHYHSWIRNGLLCVDSEFSCKRVEADTAA